MNNENKQSIHTILAHSYIVYFIFSILGLFADTMFHFDIDIPFAEYVAVLFFVIGPALVIWAQYTSKKHTLYFNYGPYKFLRNPTHLGLLILVTGFSLVSTSVIFFIITFLGYILSSYFFQKYEVVLHSEINNEYTEYKNKTPKIL